VNVGQGRLATRRPVVGVELVSHVGRRAASERTEHVLKCGVVGAAHRRDREALAEVE
jgi:hypothetical protein